jgi:MFS family permease
LALFRFACALGFAFFPLALGLMFAVGGGVILAAAAVNTILQTIVPDPLRGRVAGFFTLAFLGMAPLGNLAAGALANVAGVQATFLANGLAATIAALWFWRALPALRELMRSTYLRLGIIPGDG